MRPSFTAQEGSVFWGTARLRDQDVEALLSLFQHAHEPAAYNDLHEAYVSVGGIPWVSCFRKVA